MWRNQSVDNESGGNRRCANNLTRSTIHSILQADDILRTKVLSYLGPGRGKSSEVDVVFPDSAILELFNVLHGVSGSCQGQTIHQVLRDPSTLKKQLFYGLCKALFNDVTARSISEAWRRHNELFAYSHRDLFSFQEYVDIWASAIKQTTLNLVTVAVQELLYHCATDDRYSRYVDWMVAVGIIPIWDRPINISLQRRADEVVSKFFTSLQNATLLSATASSRELVNQIVIRLLVTDVPNSDTVVINRIRNTGEIQCSINKRPARAYVHTEPLSYSQGTGLLYTTPLAHLYREVLSFQELRQHRKMCQLLNTFPVKVVTSSRHEMNTKKVVEMMEKRDKLGDAKASIVKFLLNLSESKSKIGIQDSVESFLQDVTPSIINPERLLPPRGPNASSAGLGGQLPTSHTSSQDVRDVFKRQVIKCLEQQLQDQAEEIQDLKIMNEVWEKRTQEFQSLLERYQNELRRGQHLKTHEHLDTMPTAHAIQHAQTHTSRPYTVDDNKQVANSFFSQYVPDIRYADERLSALWEFEYTRTYRFKRNVTYQGDETSLTYSNYTIERVLVPFLINILQIPHLEPIPEEYLFLSFNELINVTYEDSKLFRYVGFICNREIAAEQHRQRIREAAIIPKLLTLPTLPQTTADTSESWSISKSSALDTTPSRYHAQIANTYQDADVRSTVERNFRPKFKPHHHLPYASTPSWLYRSQPTRKLDFRERPFSNYPNLLTE